MRQDEWGRHLVAVVAEQVRRYRKARRMSAQKLADRCAELGYPIPRSVLTNIENGRRDSISIAELRVIAAALEVAPALLEVPLGRVARVEVLPDVEVPALDAWYWFVGSHGLEEAGFREADIALISLYGLYDAFLLPALEAQQRMTERGAELAATDPAQFAALQQQVRGTANAVRDARARIRDRGGLAPELPIVLAHPAEASDGP